MARHDSLRIDDMTHEPKLRGRDIGRPTVKVDFGADESREAVSVLNTFEAYNWQKKVSDGHSFLVLGGHRPLAKANVGGLETLLYNLSPRYCEVQASGFHKPSREVKSYIDSYLVDLKEYDADYDEEVMEFFGQQSRNFDSADFMFRFHGTKPTERSIREFKSNVKTYPHNIHLYVNDSSDDWRKDYERAVKLAGSNGWNVVPPFEIASDAAEDDENEES